MRNRLNDIPAPRATTRWLRAGILVLLLAAYAAPAALTPITTAHLTEGNTQETITAAHGSDIVVSKRKSTDPTSDGPTFEMQGVHAWAG